MKKLKLRQGIASILLAGTILVTGSSLTGCSDSEYPNNNSTFIDKEYNDEDTGKTKIFQPGEHIISKNTTEKITEEDLVIITADHGNDPTAPGSDHTREYVPLVVYRKNGKNINLGTRTSFADIGATIAENFNLKMPEIGKSFLNEI